jgi:predicted MPP superfamily phosphohydrolase
MASKQLSYSTEELDTFKGRIEALEADPATIYWYIRQRSTEKILGYVTRTTGNAAMSPRLNLINLTDINEDMTILGRMINWINLDDVLSDVFSAFVMCGDFISATQMSKANYAAACAAFWAQAGSCPIPVLACLGNHDLNHDGTNNDYFCDKSEHREYFFQPMLDLDETLVADVSNEDACYCYKDFATHKTRVIILDQYDFPYTYDGEGNPDYSAISTKKNIGYSEAQLNWLVSSLNIASDWNVIIVCHEGIYENANAVGGTDDCLIAILAAFKNKTTVNTSATSPLSFTINGDFSSNSGKIIILHGHNHRFLKSTVSGINQYQLICGDSFNRASKHLRAEDSIASDAADIFSYDIDLDSFYFLRYGIINREWSKAGLDDDINGFHYIDTPETF